MKQFTFIIALLILTVSCTEKKKSKSTQIQPQTLSKETEEDTILERNNPNKLDLTKHQIFIDTTRNSIFYDNIKKWSESKWDKQSINSSLNAINKNFKPKQIDLKNFPSHFITLRMLNDQFVLYDRCDGIDPRFEIRDTAFIFYGPLESDAESISKMISLTKNSIELELRTFQAKSSDQKSRVKIEKIDDFIYKMTYSNQAFDRVEYLTTVDKIEKFDLVVNNCPTMKMLEFDEFDNEEK